MSDSTLNTQAWVLQGVTTESVTVVATHYYVALYMGDTKQLLEPEQAHAFGVALQEAAALSKERYAKACAQHELKATENKQSVITPETLNKMKEALDEVID